ncbi:MAG: multiple sugar transport system permease protein [Halanaerobiales bacterium]|nr:multiple sugar transport system permease protein [Halanaerobiales bacterium]
MEMKIGSKSNKIKYYFLVPALTVLIFMTIVPLIFSLGVSFTNYSPTRIGSWSFIGFENFIRTFTDSEIGTSFINNVIFVVVSVTIEFVLGMVIALLLNRKIRGISFIRTMFLLPMMVTPVAVGLMWRWLLNTDYGLLNYFIEQVFGITSINWLGSYSLAMPSIILVDIWKWTPFMILSLLAGLQSLSQEPIEAARIDGASNWQIFRYVTLPRLKNIIFVILLIRTIDCLTRSFDVVWTLTNGGPGLSTELLSLRIYRLAFKFWETGYASAVSWLYLLLVIFITTRFISYLYKQEF